MRFLNRLFAPASKKEGTALQASYNEEGYYIHSAAPKKHYYVTVIMPVFNAEKTLKKTIDSVVGQTIGFENIEFIIIDDKSTDSSQSIILDYAKSHPNIVPVFYKKNNGSPAKPRNAGMDLAKGKYIMFIDSDDWLTLNGIEILYKLLEKTGDPYAIGRTVKAEDNKLTITGEYNSCENRESIDPCSIPHVFHHLGPTARMMRADFLKEHHFRFPNMRFAEDKQFFIDVLTNCPTISTTKEIIYYVNRNKENKSLTSKTSIFEKTDTNLEVIKYVIQKNLPEHIERMVLNRLYEFDCITRLFNRQHFLRSKQKEKYFKKFANVLETTKDLTYDFTENFFEPWHKVLVYLFNERRFDDIVTLIDWSLNESIKQTVIIDGLPYYKLPLEDPYQLARINMLAVFHASDKKNDELTLQVHIYGDPQHQIDYLVMRERNNQLIETRFPIKQIDQTLYEASIPYDQLEKLSSASYAVYIQYDQYRKMMIKMNSRNVITQKQKKFDFYTTIGDNYGLIVKGS